MPFVGTYKDIKRAVANPSWKTIGSAAVSGVGDILMLSGIGTAAGAALKGVNTANKVAKATRAVNKAQHAFDIARPSASLSRAAELEVNLNRAQGNLEIAKYANDRNKIWQGLGEDAAIYGGMFNKYASDFRNQ